MNEASTSRCGTVALLGRPNAGKSTLLNALLDYHLSIVTPKPQTTRHRILGVVTRPEGQILFLDTPGLHAAEGRALNRRLNRTVHAAIAEADLLVQVVVAERWTAEDGLVREAMERSAAPRLLVINKVDLVRDKGRLLPWVAERSAEHAWDEIFYVSARRREGLEPLVGGILRHLPPGEPRYEADQLTDRSERFLAAEMVREQLMLRLQEELPYALTVEVERFAEAEDGSAEIHAVIWVERDGQKAIVIGRGGQLLKLVGTGARRRIEEMLGRHVRLQLWVRVRRGWSDDDAALARFGID